jgi:hypothetical protein
MGTTRTQAPATSSKRLRLDANNATPPSNVYNSTTPPPESFEPIPPTDANNTTPPPNAYNLPTPPPQFPAHRTCWATSFKYLLSQSFSCQNRYRRTVSPLSARALQIPCRVSRSPTRRLLTQIWFCPHSRIDNIWTLSDARNALWSVTNAPAIMRRLIDRVLAPHKKYALA